MANVDGSWNTVVKSPLGDQAAVFTVTSNGDTFTGEHVLATTDHGGPVTAAIGRDTMIGVQFHPEKSQRYGIALLERFLKWRP